MSLARGCGQNGGHYYSNITQPVEIDLNFTVDSTNGNGLGVRSIKSNGYVQNVFMHTSVTPGAGLGGLVNPNPASGYVMVQFKNNFRYYLNGYSGQVPVLTSASQTSTTAGSIYIITSLGSTTLAQWQAAGLLPGFVPAVGSEFVAKATGSIGGSGTVGSPGVPTAPIIAAIGGDPLQTINNSSIATNGGAYQIFQFLAPTSSSVTTLVATAPANNSVIAMTFKFDISSVSIPDGGPSNSGSGGL